MRRCCDANQTHCNPSDRRVHIAMARSGDQDRVFLTNINCAAATAATIKLNSHQEGAMAAKLKSAKVRGAAPKRASPPSVRRGSRPAAAPEAWEQTAQVPEDRDAELDYQRIVQGDGGRSLPLYYDDYN